MSAEPESADWLMGGRITAEIKCINRSDLRSHSKRDAIDIIASRSMARAIHAAIHSTHAQRFMTLRLETVSRFIAFSERGGN
jgi:hypothetical protein